MQTESTILTPVENADQIKEFLEDNGIEYFYLPVLYPESYSRAEKLSAG